MFLRTARGNRTPRDAGGPSQPCSSDGKRGIYFDVGLAAGSFKNWSARRYDDEGWRFKPDSTSPICTFQMNAGMKKDMLNVATKLMALGPDVTQVFEEMTARRPLTRFATTSLAKPSTVGRACRFGRSQHDFTESSASWDMNNQRKDASPRVFFFASGLVPEQG